MGAVARRHKHDAPIHRRLSSSAERHFCGRCPCDSRPQETGHDMFIDAMRQAIAEARSLARLDELSRSIWQGFGAGAVTDDQAQELAELLHASRGIARPLQPVAPRAPGRPSIFPPRRAQITSDRAASRARRRQLAASGPMPPALASAFTQGELAALKVISDQVRDVGCCDRTLAEIAARAGVGRTTAQNAIRQAARLGLLTVQERRRDGQKNLPNVIRVVSREWSAWIARGRAAPGQPIGFKKLDPTGSKFKKVVSSRSRGGEIEPDRQHPDPARGQLYFKQG